MSEPVVALLEEPREWPTLNQWAKQSGFGRSRLRQVLAWLEQCGRATTFCHVQGHKMTVYWATAGWISKNTGALLPPT